MAIPPISISAFSGETPAIDTRLIGENNASDSVNAWLFSGRIEPVHSLKPLHVMTDPSSRSWFRIPKTDPGADHMGEGASWWLEFENENVRVIRSPVVGQDDDGRYYWADGLAPKMLTGTMVEEALGAPVPSQPVPWRLGVPTPSTAPLVLITGGTSSTNKFVSYTYTWVTELGEEGPPAPPTTVSGKIDAIYTLTLFRPRADQTAGRNLKTVRIYRTIVSAQGVAIFFFVDEMPITRTVYVDDTVFNSDARIVSNGQLRSLAWSEPPSDLQGLVSLPNGMVAGWRMNEVWFCEPYYPHAWPIQYIIAVDADIVGLGVHQQSLLILTSGQPYAATGVTPDSMALAKVQPMETCTSRRSIVNTPAGVLFCSPNGLVNITAQGAENLTKDLLLKDQWAARLNLPTVTATTVINGYYCFSAPVVGAFQPDAFQPDAFQIGRTFADRPGMYISRATGVTTLNPSPSQVFNVMMDLFNSETMQLRDGIVYLVDIRQTAPYARYRWKSKIFTLPYLQNLGAAKVYWTPADPAAVAVLGKSYFRMYAAEKADLIDDGLPLRFQQEMVKSGQMFRLPSGYKAQYYQFEVEGVVNVDAIHAAQTARELRHI